MKEKDFVVTIEKLTMPEKMREQLVNECQKQTKHKGKLFRYSKAVILAASMLLLIMVSIPSYAAYDLYQTKNIEVFFDYGISEEQVEKIGAQLSSMEEISQLTYISAKEAWEQFSKECLGEELAASFTENPLADSFSYRVTIKLNADTKAVRHQIEQIEGVRHTLDRYELKK